jgi:riboflavin transporter
MKEKTMRVTTRQLSFAAMFAALSFILRFTAFTTVDYRFTFDDIALLAAGMVLGPVLGLITGFVADVIYSLLMGFPLGIFTLASMSWGFVAGLLVYNKPLTLPRISTAVLVTSLVAFSITTFALFQLFNTGILAGLPARLVTLVIKWPIQIGVLYVVATRVVPVVRHDQ